MDHLPWRHSNRSRPRVPYICSQLTDDDIGSTWESFIEAFTRYDQGRGKFDPAVDLVRCQTWLFFNPLRMLVEKADRTFSLQDFVDPDDQRAVSTATLLPVLQQLRGYGQDGLKEQFKASTAVSKWTRRAISAVLPELTEGIAERTEKDAGNRWSGEFRRIFKNHHDHDEFRAVARRWLSRYIRKHTNHPYASEQDEQDAFKMFWSTALLHCLIFNTPEDKSAPEMADETTSILNASSFIVDELRLRGRCPTVLARTKLSLLDVWTLLATPLQPEGYASGQAPLHTSCVESTCKAFDIDESTYVPRHAPTCDSLSDCDMQGLLDEGFLVECLKRHVIPIVRSTIDRSGLHISIIGSDKVPAFTAISHVWAGGLGNFTSHKLYMCQLLYLHRLTSPSSRLFSTAYYWLDTLCMPLQNSQYKEEALGQMASIYASSAMVLVLDPFLQRTDAQGLDRRELAALIASSPWMVRSWTLPEGALAVDLRFRFRHATLTFDRVESSSGPLVDSQLRALWHRDVDRSQFNHQPSITRPEDRLMVAWQELQRRSSTKMTDIAAILSIFVDRSSSELMRLPHDRRIHALLRNQTRLPMCLLFVPTQDAVGCWTPKLPSCNDAFELMKSSTHLRFISGGLLETLDLRELYVLRSIQEVPLSGEVLVYDMVDGASFEVRFPTAASTKAKVVPSVTGDVLFVLPRAALDGQSSSSSQTSHAHQGLCFIMRPGHITAEHAHFYQCFLWRRISAAGLFRPQPTSAVAPPFASSAATVLAARFPPVQNYRIEHAYRLVLDMGVSDWASLTWSRKRFYPFIGSSVQAARFLWILRVFQISSYVVLAFRSGAFLFSALIFLLEGETRIIDIWWNFLIGTLALCIVFVAGNVLRNKEQSFIRHLSRIRLQKIWAASYGGMQNDSNTDQIESIARYDAGSITILATLYVAFSAGALVLVPRYATAALVGLDKGEGESGGSTYEKLIFFNLNAFILPVNAFQQVENFSHVLLSVTLSTFCCLCAEMIIRDLLLGAAILNIYCCRRPSSSSPPLPDQNTSGDDLDVAISAGIDPKTSWGNSTANGALVVLTTMYAIVLVTAAVASSIKYSTEDFETPGHSDAPAMLILLWLFALVFVGGVVAAIFTLVEEVTLRFAYWKRFRASKAQTAHDLDDDGSTRLDDLART